MTERRCTDTDDVGDSLPELVEALVSTYRADPRAHRINQRFLPSRVEIIEILQTLLELLYPGYYGRQDLTDETVGYHVGVALSSLREKLVRQIELCLCHRSEARSNGTVEQGVCRGEAKRLALGFLKRLPQVRTQLINDVQAAYDGDPAAGNLDEIILAYPGLLAISVYRLAHELYQLGVPLMPRIMTEWAHTQTGADIHPGATIGPSFFLDHATGAVIGETTQIGAHVKLYQGVTLGALSHPHDEDGQIIRGAKRHPTVNDHVTVYANATVLGGTTVLGAGSVIGGSVFITRSVPEGSRGALKPPELRMNPLPNAAPRPAAEEQPLGDLEQL